MTNRANQNWPDEMVHEIKLVECSRCHNHVDVLTVFPGKVCLPCWEAKEGKAPLTQADFDGMVNTFRGRKTR